MCGLIKLETYHGKAYLLKQIKLFTLLVAGTAEMPGQLAKILH